VGVTREVIHEMRIKIALHVSGNGNQTILKL
jgi:hypothetical protein